MFPNSSVWRMTEGWMLFLCVYMVHLVMSNAPHILFHLFLGTWCDSVSWLLWIKISWDWRCRYLPSTQISFPLDVYTLLEFLALTEVLILILCYGCTNFYALQPYASLLFDGHPHQHLLSLVFLTIDTLTSLKWYLIVVLICISLMIGHVDTEHYFIVIHALGIFCEMFSLQCACCSLVLRIKQHI